MGAFNRVASTLAFFLVLLFPHAQSGSAAPDPSAEGGPTLYFFWGEGCTHCIQAKPFLAELQKKNPRLRVVRYEVYGSKENLALLKQMAQARGTRGAYVPTFIIGEKLLTGFSPELARDIEGLVAELMLTPAGRGDTAGGSRPGSEEPGLALPFVGRVDATKTSLPVFTLIIAGLDSFNPCAFFVLFFLLSLLIHVHSRTRMLVVGGTFVFFSGFLYFLFMAAWLNVFVVVGHLAAVTTAAALVALFIAAVNIKDFFFFEEGISLVIPEAAKPKLFDRMREIVHAGSLPMMLAGTATLALAANSYELLCTAGFPMVYTRVLTLNALPRVQYYLYLACYNLVYVVPLATIVVFFVVTLGSRKLTERQGRLLKLVSGCMMLGLGTVLLVKPALLNNALSSVALLGATLFAAAGVAWATHWWQTRGEIPR